MQLFRLLSGFVHSQVVLACVRLELFEALGHGALTPSELAAKAGIDGRRMLHLLRAAAALELLERRPDGRFGLGTLGASMLDNPSVVAMAEHHASFYADLADPVSLFRGEGPPSRLSALWGYAGSEAPAGLKAQDVAAYTELMATSQSMVAEQVIDACDLGRHRRLLDIGGGAGAFAIEVAARWPGIRITVADLPAVADIARARIDAAGMSGRIDTLGVDVTRQALPDHFDAVSLIRILHDHDDARAIDILRAARAALRHGGELIVAEPMADAARAGPWIDAYFNVYLLAMGSGRPRRTEELAALLAAAGFGAPRRLRTRVPLITSVLVATA